MGIATVNREIQNIVPIQSQPPFPPRANATPQSTANRKLAAGPPATIQAKSNGRTLGLPVSGLKNPPNQERRLK